MPAAARRCALVVVAALIATACGSRLPDNVLAEYDRAQLRSGSAAGAATQQETGDGTTTNGGDQTQTTTGSGTGNSGGTSNGATQTGPGGNGPNGPGTQAACSGGSTDTGVTATEIKVAAMVTDSGPLPGATAGNFRGAAAYMAKVNAEGGVCGRKVTIVKGDDGLDPQRARSEFQRLEPSMFAFVGSLAVADSGYVDLAKKTGVPYVGTFVDPAGRTLPNTVPHAEPGVGDTGQYVYFKNKYPNVNNVGFLYSDVGGVRSNTPGAIAGWKASGFTIVRNSGIRTTDPDYTSEVIALRRDNVQLLYLFAFEINMHVRLARNMRQQNWEPPLKVSNIGYNSRLVKLLGEIANGWKNHITYLPMLNPDEPARSPALAEFIKWNEATSPGAQIDLFPVNGWAAAAQFVEALKVVGGDLTREKVIKAVDSLQSSDGGGMTGTIYPKERRGSGCFIVVRVEKEKWVREFPPSGYECNMGKRYTF